MDWTREGYWDFPLTAEKLNSYNPRFHADWRRYEQIVAGFKAGKFGYGKALLDLYDNSDSWELGSACMDLLGDAAPFSVFEPYLKLVSSGDEPTASTELGEALALTGRLDAIPLLAEGFRNLEGYDDADSFPPLISLLLEDQPDKLDTSWEEMPRDAYQSLVMASYDAVAKTTSDTSKSIYRGKIFDIRTFVERTLEDIETAAFEPFHRHKFEAFTGIDCASFYTENGFQPLAAQAIFEDFLESEIATQFEPGQRYFFGHKVPD